MRPVIPALAALAWGEPRRRKYWEQELLNALDIVDRGWSTPDEMRGSWAGAMGHTQWMPEVWLNMGVDYDQRRPRLAVRQARRRARRHRAVSASIAASGTPASTGATRCAPNGSSHSGSRSYDAWQKAGVMRADGKPFPQP